jgi:hypothetical protein
MATTTNYGWETPDDTDLVKDGAAAIRSLGSSIDSTFAELKGGTSGQMLTKASNTDNDYAWVTPEIGDITAITATSPLTGGGTTGDVTVGIQDGTTSQKGAVQLEDSTSSTSTVKAATPNSVKSAYDLANAAIPKSTATTAGDILYRNGSTVTRLGIGTAGQVLKVNSGATAPEWGTASGGGGMTLLSTTTLSGSATTVSSISQDYKELKIYLKDFSTNNGAGAYIYVEFNSDTTASNYLQACYRQYPAGQADFTTNSQTGLITNGFEFPSASVDTFSEIHIPNYADTTVRKIATSHTVNATSGDPISNTGVRLAWKGTAAISQLVFRLSAGSYTAGTVEIYGVK